MVGLLLKKIHPTLASVINYKFSDYWNLNQLSSETKDALLIEYIGQALYDDKPDLACEYYS